MTATKSIKYLRYTGRLKITNTNILTSNITDNMTKTKDFNTKAEYSK